MVGRERELFRLHQNDMIALRTPPDEDRLTLFLQQHIGSLIRKRDQHDHSSREAGPVIGYYSEDVTRHIVSTISAIIAAVLLIGMSKRPRKVCRDLNPQTTFCGAFIPSASACERVMGFSC